MTFMSGVKVKASAAGFIMLKNKGILSNVIVLEQVVVEFGASGIDRIDA